MASAAAVPGDARIVPQISSAGSVCCDCAWEPSGARRTHNAHVDRRTRRDRILHAFCGRFCSHSRCYTLPLPTRFVDTAIRLFCLSHRPSNKRCRWGIRASCRFLESGCSTWLCCRLHLRPGVVAQRDRGTAGLCGSPGPRVVQGRRLPQTCFYGRCSWRLCPLPTSKPPQSHDASHRGVVLQSAVCRCPTLPGLHLYLHRQSPAATAASGRSRAACPAAPSRPNIPSSKCNWTSQPWSFGVRVKLRSAAGCASRAAPWRLAVRIARRGRYRMRRAHSISRLYRRMSSFAPESIDRMTQFMDAALRCRRAERDSKQSIELFLSPRLDSILLRYRDIQADIPCQSPYRFPQTERELLDVIGGNYDAIRLMGAALSLEPNACVLIFGSLDDVQRVCDLCRFTRSEGPRHAFPVHTSWRPSYIVSHVKRHFPDIQKVKLSHRLGLLNRVRRHLPDQWFLVVMERPDRSKGRSAWEVSFPGGKRMLGESALYCTIREMREEVGLECDLSRIDSYPPVRVYMDSKFCGFLMEPGHLCRSLPAPSRARDLPDVIGHDPPHPRNTADDDPVLDAHDTAVVIAVNAGPAAAIQQI